jgi:hypothetical protein
MLKWLAIALLCALLIIGCATQSPQPASEPASITPIGLNAGTNVENKVQPVKITTFSNYDEIVVGRITDAWYKILESQNDEPDQNSKIIMKFKLHSDGTISNIKTIRNDCGFPFHYYCVRAIKKSAPFPKWTPEMVKKLGTYIDVQFTFEYFTQSS